MIAFQKENNQQDPIEREEVSDQKKALLLWEYLAWLLWINLILLIQETKNDKNSLKGS